MTARPEMTTDRDTDTTLAPLSKEVQVACSPERAFEVFTRSMSQWWPLRTHSVYGDDAVDVTFGSGVGDEIIESSRTGESCSWGRITSYEPGRLLRFDWYPGIPEEQVTNVEVRFMATDGGTRVELVHSGWERRDRPAERRAEYQTGWDPVLARYAEVVAAAGI